MFCPLPVLLVSRSDIAVILSDRDKTIAPNVKFQGLTSCRARDEQIFSLGDVRFELLVSSVRLSPLNSLDKWQDLLAVIVQIKVRADTARALKRVLPSVRRFFLSHRQGHPHKCA